MTTLLIANNGGHIRQLHALAPRFELTDDRLWVTVRTEQTEALIGDEPVVWLHEAPTRDWKAVARNARLAHDIFRRHHVMGAISTGSSLALSVMPHARARRIPCHYIESVTRTDGPSLTGRILAHVPGVQLYSQWTTWANDQWQHVGSVLDGYEVVQDTSRDVGRVVVSLGTSGRYGFRRMLERLVDIIPDDVEVMWQTGCTDTSGLGIEARATVPGDELEEAIARSDVLVAHAGAGITISALDSGKLPLLVPRRAELGEHVDDHQEQIAGNLAMRNLAIVRDADEVDFIDLRDAATQRVNRAPETPRFDLATPPLPLVGVVGAR